ncbi:hypothetical protein ABDK09_05345 [Vibrio sp. CDRSL-10 TSBA]
MDAQHYGWLFAVNILGVMSMSVVNRQLVHRFRLDSLLKVTTFIAITAIAVMAIGVKAEIGGIWMIILPIFVFFSMNGVIAASATAAALDQVDKSAGSASAVIGSLQYGSGIISSLLLAAFRDGTPWTMTWIITLFTALSALLLWVNQSNRIS